MSKPVRRRTLLIGAVGAIAVVGGGAAAVRLLMPAALPADAEEAGYAKLLADIHADYVNGRVVEHEGWILSQHEFDTLATRLSHEAGKAAPSVG